MTGLSIKPIGDKILYLKKSKEHYKIEYPESALHNIVMGNMYVYHQNQYIVKNLEKNIESVINFHKKGWTSSNDYLAEGTITKDGVL